MFTNLFFDRVSTGSGMCLTCEPGELNGYLCCAARLIIDLKQGIEAERFREDLPLVQVSYMNPTFHHNLKI